MPCCRQCTPVPRVTTWTRPGEEAVRRFVAGQHRVRHACACACCPTLGALHCMCSPCRSTPDSSGATAGQVKGKGRSLLLTWHCMGMGNHLHTASKRVANTLTVLPTQPNKHDALAAQILTARQPQQTSCSYAAASGGLSRGQVGVGSADRWCVQPHHSAVVGWMGCNAALSWVGRQSCSVLS